jgi:hypothetical protein
MRNHGRWLTISFATGLVALIGLGLGGGRADEPKRLTAEDVVELWKPNLEGTEDFHLLGSSPEQAPRVAAYTFRVVGPSFERLWNHYADLCGVKDRYQAKLALVTGNTGPKGSYVVSEQSSSDAKEGRRLSLFLLRTDRYTVTATIQPDPDGKSVGGSIAAMMP